MDKPTSGRPADVAAGGDVLDEADPHAGDDADWEEHDLAAAVTIAPEPSPLLFWKGLLLALLLSAAAWCVLAALAFALYIGVTR
jgi:hypothetical protein